MPKGKGTYGSTVGRPKKKKKRKKYSEEAILKEIREIIKNDENKAK